MIKILILGSLVLVSASCLSVDGSDVEGAAMAEYLLIDDFTGETSKLGTEWKGFTDQVMGGISEISVVRIPDSEGPFIRMQGSVSLENNGGFIQISLKLEKPGLYFDGTSYRGVRVKVRGEGSGYYIFIRNSSTLFPWKYYAAPVPVTEEWQTVDIPWEAFEPGDYGRMGEFKVKRLRSVALVAYGKEFNANVDLKEIGFY